jgi:hypothetical protein
MEIKNGKEKKLEKPGFDSDFTNNKCHIYDL